MARYTARRDDASAPFFDGLAQGQLMIKRCGCGRLVAPDRSDCPECADPTFEWVAASGRGTLVSWIVQHPRSSDEGDTTETTGLVELDEGPWVYGIIVGAHALDQGSPVVLDVMQPADGEPIPAFRPL